MQEFEPVEPRRFDPDKIVNVIEKLIDQCRDGEQIYADAAQHIGDPQLKERFAADSKERARFASDLKAELERQGRWQTTREGSVTGMVERTAFDIKRALGGNDPAILQALEHYEDTPATHICTRLARICRRSWPDSFDPRHRPSTPRIIT